MTANKRDKTFLCKKCEHDLCNEHISLNEYSEEIIGCPKCYNIVYVSKGADKIKSPNQQITIPLTEEDLSRLQNGESFDWTFDDIDVHLELEN